MNSFALLKPLFVLGFAAPYVYFALSGVYLSYLDLIFQSLSAASMYTIPSIFGLISLVIYAGKPLFRSKEFYQDIFAFAMISPLFLPSLLFMTSLILDKNLLGVSINMYLAGIAVILVLIPWFVLASQIEAIVKIKGSVVLPPMSSFAAYGLVYLLVGTGSSKDIRITDLSSLGSGIIREMIPQFLTSFSNQSSTLLSSDTIWIGAVFALTSAFYFYYRLSNPRDEQLDPTRPEKVFPSSFFSVGLTVLAAISLNLLLMLLGSSSGNQTLFLNISLIGTLILAILAIPRS